MNEEIQRATKRTKIKNKKLSSFQFEKKIEPIDQTICIVLTYKEMKISICLATISFVKYQRDFAISLKYCFTVPPDTVMYKNNFNCGCLPLVLVLVQCFFNLCITFHIKLLPLSCLTFNTFICQRKIHIVIKKKTTFEKCANVGRGKCAKSWR